MMKNDFKNVSGELLVDYPLAKHTSWHVGGKAKQCYRPQNLADLQIFLQQLSDVEPLTWLGLGSNVLIRDGGIDGTTILTLNRLNALSLENNRIRAEAGVTCAKLSKFCVNHSFASGAFFAGIPGTVGGALAMNAGAFGGETWRYVEAVEMVNRAGEIIRRSPTEFHVQYREVKRDPDEFFAAGIFCFPTGDINQGKENIRELLQKRNSTQPIGTFSCGSVFRNPEGDYAGRLVEKTGLKGYKLGNAQVSEVHANFILNNGQATAAQIEQLINYVREQVWQHQGVQLNPEVHIIGKA